MSNYNYHKVAKVFYIKPSAFASEVKFQGSRDLSEVEFIVSTFFHSLHFWNPQMGEQERSMRRQAESSCINLRIAVLYQSIQQLRWGILL